MSLLSFVRIFGQPKAKPEEAFWNRADFWESPAMKTPYRENLTEEEKIAGLSKFWAEAKYNFINFHLVPELDWDKTYLEFLPKVRATRSTLEYYRVLEEFCAKLNDGHTRILPPDELSDTLYSRPLIITDLIEDRVIVTDLLDEKLAAEGLEKGLEVIEVEGVPVKKYAREKIFPYVSDSIIISLPGGGRESARILVVGQNKFFVFKRNQASGSDMTGLIRTFSKMAFCILHFFILHFYLNFRGEGSKKSRFILDGFSFSGGF